MPMAWCSKSCRKFFRPRGRLDRADGCCSFEVLYELSAGSGGTWTQKILHTFGSTPTDGTYPNRGVIFD